LEQRLPHSFTACFKEVISMPIYGYVCNKCGHTFEMLVFSSEIPACLACESTDLVQQLSLTAPPAKSGRDVPVCDRIGSCGGCSAGLRD
jgi:putative FmdB family regulatory protein